MPANPPCTHADAGEAREIAIRAYRKADAASRNARAHWIEPLLALMNATAADVLNITRCPDCGRWREGA